MEFLVRLHRKRSWGVVVLAALTGCFGMQPGSGEMLLPEVGATSTPPPAGTEAAPDKTAMLFIVGHVA